jgi:glutamine amidotransferase/cyclase
MRAGAPSTAAPRSANGAAAPTTPAAAAARRLGRGRRAAAPLAASSSREVTLLDYGAGNVRSVRNAIKRLGWTIKDVSCCCCRCCRSLLPPMPCRRPRPRSSPAPATKKQQKQVESSRDLLTAERVVFPGVGTYGQARDALKAKGLEAALKEYLQAGRPFLGICLGLQLLFEGSDESGGVEGLGLIPGRVRAFDPAKHHLPVPHIGWNTLDIPDTANESARELLAGAAGPADRVYFVHTYRATVEQGKNEGWVAATSTYGDQFVAAVAKGEVSAVQFHPEKSGAAGLRILGNFLAGSGAAGLEAAEKAGVVAASAASAAGTAPPRGLARRVIACLDVRANDSGDLVVTKGDQYDVREPAAATAMSAEAGAGGGASREVRNLGKPVELAARYFDEGADEVAFLNITGFRDCPVGDLPMLAVLRAASERVFVPMTVGGGIRGFTVTEQAGGGGGGGGAGGSGSGNSGGGATATATATTTRTYSALEVAAEYFRSGADKVSIGSDAVEAALELRGRGGKLSGDTAIEQISRVYGKQAVVVSIDPKRVYVPRAEDVPQGATALRAAEPGPGGEEWCWWQATVKGGREGRPIDAVELARACEAMGAGEIMLNAIDNDGTGKGFDLALVDAVSGAVSVPVIASSGAGAASHFSDVFRETRCSAALAAGIFHRREVAISEVKAHMAASGLPARV